MSAASHDAAAKWLEQLLEMKAAIAELNLPKSNEGTSGYMYGQYIALEYEDWSDPATSEQDLSEDSPDAVLETPESEPATETPPGSREWLKKRCEQAAAKGLGLDASTLEEQIVAIAASDSTDDELQTTLVDVLGLEELEFVSEIIKHRKLLLNEPSKSSSGILSKAERDARLRRQDFEHKNATLAAAQDRSVTQYPHVYKTHDAGNTLSTSGKKYQLPFGSERLEREKYEEYSIPAAKVGVLGRHQSLVPIKDMDGLAQTLAEGTPLLPTLANKMYEAVSIILFTLC